MLKNFLLNHRIYLDNSATTRFKPKTVIKAVESTLRCSANAGRGGHEDSIRSAIIVENTREIIKSITFDGIVIMTKSCTEALNLALFGLDLEGKEIVTTVFEHNSVLRPLERLKGKGVVVNYLAPEDGIVKISDLQSVFTEKTALLVMSEMSNVTGQVQNVKELAKYAREKGVLTLIDTAQSLGHVTGDYSYVDMLASSGHKGLHSPQGTGFLVFRDNISLTPLTCGGTGTDSVNLSQPLTPPEAHESGTLNTPGIAGLYEGIKWTKRHYDYLLNHVAILTNKLSNALKDIDGVKLYSDNLYGIVAFNLKGLTSNETADILDKEYGISVRSGLHCAPLMHKHLGTLESGIVRASIGVNNSESDIDALIQAIKIILKNH